MSDENGAAAEEPIAEPVDLTGLPTAKDLMPVPERRYIFNFFYQWEHRENGELVWHIYPGSIVNGTPMCQGQPVSLVFQPDGRKNLLGDVERGFKSQAVQVATELPPEPLNREQRRARR